MVLSAEVSQTIAGGCLALLGTAVAGMFSVLAAKAGSKWEQAKSDLQSLCDQVVAYHKLEELYKHEVNALDPQRGAAVTVLKNMREAVVREIGIRPKMTAEEARNIAGRYR